jgi:carbonic anhydrase
MPLSNLLANNRAWAERKCADDPEFFSRLVAQQHPEYLWIGCSDSRVPANQITGLAPGEIFVHRNVANLVVHSDLNCLSVMQFAIDALKIRHIMVVGHYGCGGVRAVFEERRLGLIDNWLRHVQDVRNKHQAILDVTPENQRLNRLCELNVIEQMANVCSTTLVQDAWARGQPLSVHGWVYGLEDGRLREASLAASSPEEALRVYRDSIDNVCRKAWYPG